MARSEKSSPIALARLEPHPHGAVWIVDSCVFCGREHRHGAGGRDENPLDFLGLRRPLCVAGHVPPDVDFSAGYVLQEAPDGFTAIAPQQVESGSNFGSQEFADSSPDTPTSSRASERVCPATRPDATTEPGPERGTQERTDGRWKRSEARHEGERAMGRTMLDAGIETLKGLSYADLGWIWVKATGGKPPVGTKKATLLESVQDLFTEKAKTEGEPEVLSVDCEAWLGEVGDGKPAPKKAEPAPAAAAEPGRVTVEQAIAALNSLSTKRMAMVHEQVVGKPGRGLKKPALFKAIAAALEKKADGKGGGATLPDEAVGWLTAAKDGKQESAGRAAAKKESKPRDPRLPAAGPNSVLTKVWRDRTLEVQVNEDDFTFEGRSYKSLSKIASELLGCPANGFLFFSLTDSAKAAAEKRAAKAAAKQAAAEAKATAEAQETKPEKPAKTKKTAKKNKKAKKA